MNITEFNEQIKKDAVEEAAILKRMDTAQIMRDRMFRAYVKAYDEELDALEQHLQSMRQARTDNAKLVYLDEAKRYLEENGEEFPPSKFKYLYGIKLAEKPTEFKFQKDFDLVQAAKDNGCPHLIRVKEEIDLTPLKRGLRAGDYEWAKAEPIEDVRVELAPLGDILIMMEVGETT